MQHEVVFIGNLAKTRDFLSRATILRRKCWLGPSCQGLSELYNFVTNWNAFDAGEVLTDVLIGVSFHVQKGGVILVP